jgi:hypothetical protein
MIFNRFLIQNRNIESFCLCFSFYLYFNIFSIQKNLTIDNVKIYTFAFIAKEIFIDYFNGLNHISTNADKLT